MSHVHVHLHVSNLEASRAFYERFLDAAVRHEMDTSCCYANEDEFWVRDPDGVEWEVYNLNHDVDEEAPASGASSPCCTPLARIGRRP